MTQKPSNSNDSQEVDFEAALERLEAIVHALESGDMGLNDALKQYEEGVACLRQCERALTAAEGRIEQLFRIDADGAAEVRDFEHQQSVAESPAKQDARDGEPKSPPNGGLF